MLCQVLELPPRFCPGRPAETVLFSARYRFEIVASSFFKVDRHHYRARSAHFRSTRSIAGISSLHGGHGVNSAQKLMGAGRPRKSAKFTVRPAKSVTAPAGSGTAIGVPDNLASKRRRKNRPIVPPPDQQDPIRTLAICPSLVFVTVSSIGNQITASPPVGGLRFW